MCGNNNCLWILILIIIIACGCGDNGSFFGGNNRCGCNGCGNNCGCCD